MGNLTTLAAQKTLLNIDALDTSSDAFLNALISLTSKQIETYLDRSLGIDDYIENLSPSNTQVMQMRQWPVNTVAYVKEDNVLLTVNVDYFLYSQYVNAGQIYRGLGWVGKPYQRGLTYDPYSNQINLEFSYNAGYNLPGDMTQTYPLPEDISYCCQLMVAQTYAKSIAGNMGDTYKSVKDGDLAYTFASVAETDASLFAIIGGLMPQFAGMLNPYRRWSVG